MNISKVKLPFYALCEVKCGLQNGVSTKSGRSVSHWCGACHKTSDGKVRYLEKKKKKKIQCENMSVC